MRSVLIPNEANDVVWTSLRHGFTGTQVPSALNPTGNAVPNQVASPPTPGRRWPRTRVTAQVPIVQGVSSVLYLLGEDDERGLLILQNNSSASITGDVAPTFYFSLGTLAQVGNSLALEPGVGLVLDSRCPVDAVYCTIGPFLNGSDSVVIAGFALSAHFIW